MALPKDETPQGKNRFIYSQNKGCWIIEFENDVFCLTNYDKVSIIAKTIQYILKHGNLDIRSAIEKCTWFYLDEAKPIIPSFLGLIDKKTDSRTINEVKKKLKELNEQLKQINNTSEKKKIKKEANKCEVYLIENSNYSIPRNFHPELGNMRNRIMLNFIII